MYRLELVAAINAKLERDAFLFASEYVIRPQVYTEGKTDWMHMKAALRRLKAKGKFRRLMVEFVENTEDVGWSDLLDLCKDAAKVRPQNLTIFVFDRDVKDALREASGTLQPGNAKRWSNKVYSFCLPVPDHRQEVADYICIELYYQDHEIKSKDKYDRRLFLNTEFLETGWHLSEDLFCKDRNKITRKIAIIDAQVMKRQGNVALPKADFAQYVLDRVENFRDFDFSPFAKIFEVICRIVEGAYNNDSSFADFIILSGVHVA